MSSVTLKGAHKINGDFTVMARFLIQEHKYCSQHLDTPWKQPHYSPLAIQRERETVVERRVTESSEHKALCAMEKEM